MQWYCGAMRGPRPAHLHSPAIAVIVLPMNVDDAAHDRARWNARYRAGRGPRRPNARLMALRSMLAPGRILDMAGGIGANARLFPESRVIVADISEAALCEARGPHIDRVQADARHLPFAPESFDSVLCTYYYEPSVSFASLLRPGGTVFFETFIEADRLKRPDFNPAYLYDPGRGAHMFSRTTILYSASNHDGERLYTTIIARRSTDS